MHVRRTILRLASIFFNNLALLYDTQGRYAKAEPLIKRSLAISEKALGRWYDFHDFGCHLGNPG